MAIHSSKSAEPATADDVGAAAGTPPGDRLALPTLLAVSAAYLLFFVRRGWIAGDVGFLGQTAERVLHGELPHRDFVDMYTGGLALLHAGVFRLFGIQSEMLRWLLFLATLLGLVAFFGLARRAVRPWGAAAVVFLGLTWGVPLYFESMPTWYNLFLAAGGAEALLRHRDGGGRRWLVVAGVACGLSLLLKSAALLFLAAALLFLVHREQDEQAMRPPGRGRGFSLFVAASLVAFAVVVVGFVAQLPTPMTVLHFMLPGCLLAGYMIWREWRLPPGHAAARARRLAALLAPFCAGFAVPLAAFVGRYLAEGAAHHLLDPAILFPAARVELAAQPLPNVRTLVALLPVAALLVATWAARGRAASLVWDRRLALPTLLLLTTLAAYGFRGDVHQIVWFTVRPLVPLLVLLGVWVMARAPLAVARRQDLFLVLALTGLFSLVQFPLSMSIYFGYVAPLVPLAYLFVVGAIPRPSPRRLHVVLGAFYLAFSMLWNSFNHPLAHGIAFSPTGPHVPSGFARADLDIPVWERNLYRDLVATVQAHSPPGSCIFAGPDAPEIYYLAERCNPTPIFTEIFESDYGTSAYPRRIVRLIHQRELPVAVVNVRPAFSRKWWGILAAVSAQYTDQQRFGNFIVYWNRRPPAGPPPPP